MHISIAGKAAADDEEPATKKRAKPVAKKGSKASSDKPTWEIEMDAGWSAYSDEDAEMLEAEFAKRGPKGKFTTKDFSFNR